MKFLSFSSVAIYVTHEVMLLKTFSFKRSPQAPKSKPPAYYNIAYKEGGGSDPPALLLMSSLLPFMATIAVLE